jgi:hypothetical protein
MTTNHFTDKKLLNCILRSFFAGIIDEVNRLRVLNRRELNKERNGVTIL